MPKPSTKATPAPVEKPKADPKPTERKVLYDKVHSRLCDGDDAITEDLAKQLLGWEETTNKTAALFQDLEGKYVRCRNNLANRPFDLPRAEEYAQTVLMRQWAGPRGNGKSVNGEAMVIGRTGLTLSCQHRLVALVLACQRWRKEQDHWAENWPEAPVMESFVNFGMDESGATTMTLDNVKTRTASDVFYCDPGIFANKPSSDRRVMCKYLENAVKVLWFRAGQDKDAFSQYRTHVMSKDSVVNHPSLMKAVEHLHTENTKGSISQHLNLGSASGMLFLMGASGTKNRDVWFDGNPRREELLDMSEFDKACEFWTLFGMAGDDTLKALRQSKSVYEVINEDGVKEKRDHYILVDGSLFEKQSLISKAWNEFSLGNTVTPAKMNLKYGTNEEGGYYLKEHHTVGGIDVGDADQEKKEEADDGGPTEEQVEAQKEIEQEKKIVKKTGAPSPKAPEPEEESAVDLIDRFRKKYPGRVLLFKGKENWVVWGKDADLLKKIGKLQTQGKQEGLAKGTFFPLDLDPNVEKLLLAGHSVTKLLTPDKVINLEPKLAPVEPEKSAEKKTPTKGPSKADKMNEERLKKAQEEDAKLKVKTTPKKPAAKK